MSLHELLRKGVTNRFDAARLRQAASHVGALGAGVEDVLVRAGVPVPRPQPGDPLLLAATATQGTLWRVARPDDPAELQHALGAESQAAWALAARVAARSLPVVANPQHLAVSAPPRVVELSPRSEASFDGSSVGLAFALLHLSRAVGVPIATDLAATAALNADGRLVPVERLPEKLAALQGWAPGIGRVLVARGQENVEGQGLEIVYASDVLEAWEVAFEPEAFDAALALRWSADPHEAAHAADAFFRFVLREPESAIRWRAVRRATAILRDRVDPVHRWRADVAHAIAARHHGQALHLPADPGQKVRRPLRLQLLAHRLQACTDQAERPAALLDEALRTVAPHLEEHPEDLELLGAIGRVYGAWGRWEQASSELLRAVHGWLELDRAPDATRPICELLRTTSLSGDLHGLLGAERLAEVCLADPRVPDHGRTFVHHALGRAWIIGGNPEQGARALAEDAAPWAEAYSHTQASRLRWLGRVGAPVEGLLQRHADTHEDDRAFLLLSRADHGDVSALEALAPNDRSLFDLGLKAEPGASVARLLDLFPY